MQVKYDYGAKDKYPVDLVPFYGADFRRIENVRETKWAYDYPERITELIIRLFVRDAKKLEDAKLAFRALCMKLSLHQTKAQVIYEETDCFAKPGNLAVGSQPFMT